MHALTKVLLATDFSTASDNALDHAAVLAAGEGATLHVLHAQVLHPETDGDFPEAARYHDLLERFAHDELAKIEPKRELPVVRKSIRSVAAAPAIVDYAESEEMELIVLGTHGRSDLPHMLVGSVAEQVVRMAQIPVLVVGRDRNHRLRGPHYEKVLVGIDFSDRSREAAESAAELISRHGGQLILVHVIDKVPHPAYFLSGKDSVLDLFPDLPQRARAALEKLRDEIGVKDAEIIVAEGRAYKKIVEIARQQDADLAVVGSSGFGGVEHFLLGSVAGKVLRFSACPVLVTPHPE